MSEANGRGCAIIPCYREGGRIGTVVGAVRAYLPDVIVVDDGSPDATADEARQAGAQVIRHEVNQGKGAALETGFQAARERRFDFVVTLDGDGQHAAVDLPRFVETYQTTGTPVLVGNRMADTRSMPRLRWLTNRLMSWLLSREMGQRVPDTQCGYRLYQLAVVPPVAAESKRFAAESEILMDLSDRGIRIGSVPVATLYGTETSKIHPVKDTLRFIRMLRAYRKRRRGVKGTRG